MDQDHVVLTSINLWVDQYQRYDLKYLASNIRWVCTARSLEVSDGTSTSSKKAKCIILLKKVVSKIQFLSGFWPSLLSLLIDRITRKQILTHALLIDVFVFDWNAVLVHPTRQSKSGWGSACFFWASAEVGKIELVSIDHVECWGDPVYFFIHSISVP